MKKKLTVAILAHVDAGKTTLSEALLYLSGKIRAMGRVDHGNTYLDTNPMERERGITVFSKQARFSTEHCDFILLDTPGHVDFSMETERTLTLPDYAILVISAADGVQSHTRTLWQLLELYRVPTFLFINKTDIAIKLREELESELAKALSSNCVAFYGHQSTEERDERLALVHEGFLESVLNGTPIQDEEIAALISQRKLFPCVFGSALRMIGVDFLLEVLEKYTLSPAYTETRFGARIYKIARDGANRLTYMKITGGALSARDELTYLSREGKRITEKVTMLRLYSGERFTQTETAAAGEICAVCGLSATYAGQGLGMESDQGKAVLEPVLSYSLMLPEGCDPVLYFPKLKELEEEEPSLHLTYNAASGQIEARLMGEIQTELILRMIRERLGISCEFGVGNILYRETVAKKAIGIGHFEPLRHYAEVQLYLEPQPKGTGLIFDTRVPENALDTNWQRLILSNLYEKDHRGVLTGAPLTDTKITLVAGKAHQKHTEGGDFREATIRAVRHGLMTAGCVLLEPYYRFRLEIPSQSVGRALSDLQQRHADFRVEATTDEEAVIVGRAPVATLHGYAGEVISYTRGRGRLTCTSDGYEPCHNPEEIIEKAGYDPEADLENPPHSVFCARGAGFVVPWNEVEQHKHLEVKLPSPSETAILPKATSIGRKYNLSDEELEAIMLREFGPIKRRRYSEPKTVSANEKKKGSKKAIAPQSNMVIIDGYNVIHAWESLRETAAFSIEKAREELMDLLSSYVAYTKTELTLVFDAYLVKDGTGSEFTHDGYRVVYTKENQTADAYIERMMHELGPNYSIRVVTADRLLQFSAVHSGILRMTPDEFLAEVTAIGNEINAFIQKLTAQG